MFSSLLDWDIMPKIILNTLFVSIPEEFFMVMFTLILMGEFDYWKEEECRKLFNRWDYVRVFVPVIASAVISNVLRYMGVDINLMSVISMLTALVLIILTGDIFGDASALKWVGKAFIFLMLASLTTVIIEFLYIPSILYGTGKTLKEVNNDIWLNFLVSLPVRTMQCFILSYFFVKKRTLLKSNIFKPIFESSALMIFLLTVIAANVVFMLIIFKTIGYEKVLVSLPQDLRTIVILGTCIFPLLNISVFLWAVYFVKNLEAKKQKTAAENLNGLLESIKIYTENGNYDNIKWKLNGIRNDIDQIAQSLYKLQG